MCHSVAVGCIRLHQVAPDCLKLQQINDHDENQLKFNPSQNSLFQFSSAIKSDRLIVSALLFKSNSLRRLRWTQGQDARRCKRRYSLKLNGMEEAVRLYIHTGTECHCMEFTNKGDILTREATLVLVSNIHETVKTYLISKTPDAFAESDVGTVIAAENWISEGLNKILVLNLIPSCRNDFDSFLYQPEPWTVFDFSINLDTLTMMTSITHFS
jgi:hypothetical protein